jgi:hypothetical protein
MESTSFICLLILFVAFGQTIIGLLSESREREKTCIQDKQKQGHSPRKQRSKKNKFFTYLFLYNIAFCRNALCESIYQTSKLS